MISLIFLYSLFNYIILYLCTLRKLILLPSFSSISLSPKKTLTLVVPLALIPHWQLNKSAEKHVLSAYRFQFKLMITHLYQVFSTAWLFLSFNGCSLPTLQGETVSQFSYCPSLFRDAAHPLCTHFSHACLCKRWACRLPPKPGLGHMLSSLRLCYSRTLFLQYSSFSSVYPSELNHSH